MSNIIIGIIGVICFIGLALAGANYLGTSVTSAKASTYAALAVADVQQIAAGIRMYDQKAKGSYLAPSATTLQTLVTNGYLKSIPTNPLIPGNPPLVVDSTGNYSSQKPTFVFFYLGNTQLALQTCTEVERHLGNKDRLDPATMGTPVPFFTRTGQVPQGCFLVKENPVFTVYYTI